MSKNACVKLWNYCTRCDTPIEENLQKFYCADCRTWCKNHNQSSADRHTATVYQWFYPREDEMPLLAARITVAGSSKRVATVVARGLFEELDEISKAELEFQLAKAATNPGRRPYRFTVGDYLVVIGPYRTGWPSMASPTRNKLYHKYKEFTGINAWVARQW